MRKVNHLRLIQLTTAELAAAPYSTRVWKRRDMVENKDTGERRQGDGSHTWAELAPTGVEVAQEVVTAATTNVTIASGLNAGDTVAGRVLVEGDAVLLLGQSTQAQNGVYTVGASPARRTGFTTYDSIAQKAFKATEGNNAGKVYRCYSATGGTIGSTALDFVQIIPRTLNLGNLNQFAGVVAQTSPVAGDLLLIQNATSGDIETLSLAALKVFCNA